MGDLLDLLERIFQGPIPQILLWVILAFFLVALLLRSISYFHQEIIPIFYSAEKARRRNRRRRFADFVTQKLEELNGKDEWLDKQFTELEAEVEAEGGRRHSLFPFIINHDALRRETSLTQALETSTERLIHLEGLPGSGKSVALRHLALMMARQAVHSRNVKTIIPLYIDLKLLKREQQSEHGTQVDANFIRHFVLNTLNSSNEPSAASFLDDEFQSGLIDGSWLFLFDSFDEIPEILGSTEADPIIQLYAEAINDFLSRMNQCRGIVASREYRGPRYLNWSKFRILPLSTKHQEELVKRAGLSSEDQTRVIGGLLATTQDTRQLTNNPMFLRLLCEYVRDYHQYPEHNHEIYDAFVTKRFTNDERRLKQRFGLTAADVRRAAENIAFCMLMDPALGLSAKGQEIELSLSKNRLLLGTNISLILDALQFIKLGKLEGALTEGSQQDFSFSHRRLQEHLATKVILREPDRVALVDLLTNGVWRESAVTLLQQTKSAEDLEPLIQAGILVLHALLEEIPGTDELDSHEPGTTTEKIKSVPQPFPWPPRLLHVMGLLQDGLANKLSLVPDALQTIYSWVILTVWDQDRWLVSDMEDALSMASLLPQDILGGLLSVALIHPSRRIRNIAYRKTAMLRNLQPAHVQAIRGSLVDLYIEGRLKREQKTTTAFIMRLDESKHLLEVMRFLRALPYLELITVVGITWIWSSVYLTAFSGTQSLLFKLSPGLFLGLILAMDLADLDRPIIVSIMVMMVVGIFFIMPVFYLGRSYGSDLMSYGISFVLVLFSLLPGLIVAKLWRVGALSLAKDGILIARYQWPIVPIYGLLHYPIRTLKAIPLVAKVVWTGTKNIWREFVLKPYLLRRTIRLVPVIILFASVISLTNTFMWAITSNQAPEFIRLISVIVVGLTSLTFLFRTVKDIFRNSVRSRKRQRILKAISTRTEKLDMDEFLRTVTELGTEGYVTSYIQLIRKRKLLSKTPQNLIQLERFTSQLQHDLVVDKGHPSDPPIISGDDDLFVRWYNDFFSKADDDDRNKYGLSILGWDVLDEINLLRRQLASVDI